MSVLAAGLLALSAQPASATVIDFESTAVGTYGALVYGPVTITFLAGDGSFEVQNQTPDPPPTGHMLISYFTNPGSGAFQAAFSGGTSSVSIDMSDYSPSDDDTGVLVAYDLFNNVLDADVLLVAPSGPGGTLSVSSGTSIARVEFYETGSFAGAVYWDNLTYTADQAAVPEPTSLLLLGSGIAGLYRRRKARR